MSTNKIKKKKTLKTEFKIFTIQYSQLKMF